MSSLKSNTSAKSWPSELRLTLKVAIPMILGQVGQIAMGVTDSLMVGHLGAVPLAASAFVNNVVSIPMVLLMGISSCISVKVSQAYGASQPRAITDYFFNGWALTLFCTLVTVLALAIGRDLLGAFGQPADVSLAAEPFFLSISVSLFPMLVYLGAKYFCDAFSHTVPGMVVLGIGLVLNIFLNWIFIYGHFGFPTMGLAGSGYATLAARTVMALVMVGYIFRTQLYRQYLVGFLKMKTNFAIVKQMAVIGFPSGLQYLFEVGAFAGSGLMMGWISTEVLAAHQIAINLASVTFMFALGLSLASSVRVGQANGRGDGAAIRRIGVSSLVFVGVMETIFAVLFLLLRDILPTAYVKDAAVIAMASQLLIVAAAFQWFDGIQALALGLLRGLSDVKIPTIITFASYWIIGMPLAYFLAFPLGYAQLGIWIGLLVALGFASVLLTWRFLRRTRV